MSDAIRDGMQIIEEAMRIGNRGWPRAVAHYLRPCEWDWLHIELAKRSSPLHKYIAMDAEGRLMCCGVELLPLRHIPYRGAT